MPVLHWHTVGMKLPRKSAFWLAICIALPGFAQDSTPDADHDPRIVTLTAQGQGDDPDQPVYSAAEILSVGASGTIMTQRRDLTEPAIYSFNLTDAPLPELLRVLALTLYRAPDFITPAGSVFISDGAANERIITIGVESLDITATLDQVAIAARCNIYLDDLTMVVDRCK